MRSSRPAAGGPRRGGGPVGGGPVRPGLGHRRPVGPRGRGGSLRPGPEEWEIDGPGIAISLGDAADLDPDLLEAMLGPTDWAGRGSARSSGRAAADALRPGPILAALTEQAVADAVTLTDDQLTGALQAARRLEARAQWQQTTLVAEYARRRAAQLADAKARGIPKGRARGSSPTKSWHASC